MFSFAFAKLQKLTPFHKKNKLESNMEVVVWWSGAPLLLQDLDDLIEMMEPWILLITKKENVQPTVPSLKLKHAWVMQQDNDLKHTSKSICE